MNTPTNYIIHTFGNESLSITMAYALQDNRIDGVLMGANLTAEGLARKADGLALRVKDFDWQNAEERRPQFPSGNEMQNMYIMALRVALQAKAVSP